MKFTEMLYSNRWEFNRTQSGFYTKWWRRVFISAIELPVSKRLICTISDENLLL